MVQAWEGPILHIKCNPIKKKNDKFKVWLINRRATTMQSNNIKKNKWFKRRNSSF